MKSCLLLIIFLALHDAKSQVPIVFCPPGAEWHYEFAYPMNSPIVSADIKHVRDSILDSVNVNVLSHTHFFDDESDLGLHLTVIKQKGDTVFFRNIITVNTWQILYNYATIAGQSWTTTIGDTVVYTIKVDSVKFVTINNFVLRRLFVTNSHVVNGFDVDWNNVITERFGGYPFMFNYENPTYATDVDEIIEPLCYQDSSFGSIQFTDKPCDYRDNVGTVKNVLSDTKIKIYPNPGYELFHVSIENPQQDQLIVHLSDISSREIRSFNLNGWEKDQQFDIGDLKVGIYFLTITRDKSIIYSTKLVKQD